MEAVLVGLDEEELEGVADGGEDVDDDDDVVDADVNDVGASAIEVVGGAGPTTVTLFPLPMLRKLLESEQQPS